MQGFEGWGKLFELAVILFVAIVWVALPVGFLSAILRRPLIPAVASPLFVIACALAFHLLLVDFLLDNPSDADWPMWFWDWNYGKLYLMLSSVSGLASAAAAKGVDFTARTLVLSARAGARKIRNTEPHQ